MRCPVTSVGCRTARRAAGWLPPQDALGVPAPRVALDSPVEEPSQPRSGHVIGGRGNPQGVQPLDTVLPATSDVAAHVPVPPSGAAERVEVLLIEDDPGDALLVEELLRETGAEVDIVWVRSIREASGAASPRTRCVLLDLGLPDATGLQALEQAVVLAPSAAIIVLTGLADAHRGMQALASGAEDYLVKSEVDGALLVRAIRYAMERKRAEESARKLVEAEFTAQENARLERGLLAVPLLHDPAVTYHARYQPGRRRALLGGDFYDVVQSPDGAVHLVIGDVSGHGPNEAALGVCLRVAWRTLVLTGRWGGTLLSTLEQVLVHERRSDEIFATVCTMTVEPSRRQAWLHLAGHPTPLAICRNGEVHTVSALPDDLVRPALGVTTSARWTGAHVELGDEWSLLLYTDGLIEGRVGRGPERLGTDGLRDLVDAHLRAGLAGKSLVDATVSAVEGLHGDVLSDDLAVLMLSHRRDR